MTLPNFIILGAAKAGTTALYHYLNQHPQVFMSPLKETNFFALMGEPLNFSGPGDNDFINRFSLTTLEQYQGQFVHSGDAIAVGEASPLYLYSPKAPPRIKQYVPDAKLIIMLRHPIERAYSAFLHLVRDGRETTTDFGEALQLEDERIAAGWEHIWHYKSMSLYYDQVKRYYDLFDRSQIRFYLYYDFRHETAQMLGDVFRFLGVDDTFAPDVSMRHNATTTMSSQQKPPLKPEVWTQLYDAFYGDILKLQELTGRDLTRWINLTQRAADLK
ncbi:MAG TPA: sulfotransferase [Abditibacteriaceae bacterium]|jgi:hypothetical protein